MVTGSCWNAALNISDRCVQYGPLSTRLSRSVKFCVGCCIGVDGLLINLVMASKKYAKKPKGEGLKGQGPRRSTIISVHDYRHFQSSVGDTLAWHFPGPSSSSTLHSRDICFGVAEPRPRPRVESGATYVVSALYSYTAGHLLSGGLHDLFSLSYLFLCTFCLKFDSIANTVQCSKFELIVRKANRPITFVGLLSAARSIEYVVLTQA